MTETFVLAAGGTGGHLFPAQALAGELMRRGRRVVVMTDGRGHNYRSAFPGAEIATVPAATFAGRSPLGRLLELETLLVGVAGKRALWATLQSLPGVSRRLPGFDLEQLAERASRQHAALEEHRLRSAREALAPNRGADLESES